MKTLVSVLCAVGLYFGLVTFIQAEKPEPLGLWEIIPGECYLDGIISPPHKSIDDMDGFEVPLVAMWSPVELHEGAHYRGDAKFGVYNFTIGEGDLIEAYTVDVNLKRDDPDLSEEERHNLFIYRCEDASGSCTATLATVKAAITEQIARENQARTDEISYQSDARATLLGVFVKGMQPAPTETLSTRELPYRLTEVCGMYELTLTEGHAISSLIRQSVKPN